MSLLLSGGGLDDKKHGLQVKVNKWGMTNVNHSLNTPDKNASTFPTHSWTGTLQKLNFL